MRLQQTLIQIFKKPHLLIPIQLVFFLFLYSNSQAQGWEKTYPIAGYENLRSEYLTLTQDGGYCLTATIEQPSAQDIAVIKVDAEGNQQWLNIFGGVLEDRSARIYQLDDGGYIVGGLTFNNTVGSADWYLLRLDELGNKLWDQNYGSSSFEDFNALHPTDDDGFLLVGESAGINRIFLRKVDNLGVEQWINTVGPSVGCSEGRDVKPTSDGGYILTGTFQPLGCGISNDKNFYVVKIDQDGEEEWSHKHGGLYNESGEDIIQTQDGGYVSTGFKFLDEENGDMHLVKLSAIGDTLWTKTFGLEDRIERGFTITEAPNGDLVSIGNTVHNITNEGFGYVIRTDADGNLIEEKILTESSSIGFPSLILPTPDDGFIISGTGDSTIALIKTDGDLNSLTITIQGNVFYDVDSDCMVDTGEEDLENWIVVADGEGNNDYFALTDAQGNYEFLCDTGQFELKVISPNHLWEMCSNVANYTLTLNDFFDTVSVDFPMQSVDDCPPMSHMTVELSAPQLRRCFENTYYIEYCNTGTLDESNAFVEILFDSFLLVTNSSLPYTDLGDNLFLFDIGQVDLGDCGNFTVEVMVDCDSTVLGQTHCVEAHIYPDSVCLLPSDSLIWDGSNMQVEGICLGDSVMFSVTNVGINPPNDPNVVRIIEDDLVISIQILDLNPGETATQMFFSGDSATIRMEVDQTPGHPGNSNPSAVVEGCGVDIADAHLGFVTQFPMDDGNHYIDIDCQENIGSYDPNDKAAYPAGYSDDNFIGNDDELEYHIRFQNTGTDTAFTVVLRDTLSEYLDPTTIRFGTSSHEYIPELLGNGILKFTFENILLPDSSTNLIESNGFIKFTIQQQEGNVPGTVIENSAGIYFDFNEPVITNTIFHTIENQINYIVEEVGVCEGDSYNGVEIVMDTVLIDTFPEVEKHQDIVITSIGLLNHSYSDSILLINNGDLFDGKPIYGDTVIILQSLAVNGCDSLQRFEITVDTDDPLGFDPRFKIHPNPTTESFFINYDLAEKSPVTIVLYDALGKKIKTILDDEMQFEGSHSFKIIAQDIIGNIVFVHWQSGNKNYIQKVIFTTP